MGNQCLEKQPAIYRYLGLYLIPPGGLRNVIDLLGIVILTHGTIAAGVLPPRLQNDDRFSQLSAQNRNALFPPIFLITQPGGGGRCF